VKRYGPGCRKSPGRFLLSQITLSISSLIDNIPQYSILSRAAPALKLGTLIAYYSKPPPPTEQNGGISKHDVIFASTRCRDLPLQWRDFGMTNMKGLALRFMIVSALLALLAFAVQLAGADSGGDGSEIEIKAPLEAVNCTAVPPTITVLGLSIDIGAAKFDDDDDEAGSVVGCGGLVVGQVVEVELASDLPNTTTGLLTALKLEAEDEECDEDECVEIEAPIEAVDAVGQTLTVLGLTIDISQAEIDGDDHGEADASDEGEGHASLDPSQLIVGQFVEVKLASNQPPLTATEIEIKNFATGLEIDVVDANGDDVDDDDDDVQVVVTLSPTPPAAGTSKTSKSAKGKKTLTFTARSKGHTVLSGLPAGRAKLLITRIHGGHKSSAKSSTVVQPQQTTHVVARLKQAK